MNKNGIAYAALALALAGCGDDGDALQPLVSSTTVEFGQTDCGTTQVPRTLLLANPTSTLLHYETAFERNKHYMVQPPSGFLLPGQQLEMTIYSAPIPAISETTENLYGDTLTITTDVKGLEPFVVDVRQTARGAILAWSASNVAFPGTSKATDRATVALSLRNLGNAPARDVTARGTAGFGFDPPDSASLAPGDLAGSATYRATVEGDETGTIAVTSAAGTLCAPLPPPVEATGNGTFAGAIPIEVDLISGASNNSSRAALFARFADGRVASLGDNELGMRGANKISPPASPTIVRDLEDRAVENIIDVVGARASGCALREGGEVLCWGNVGLARAQILESTPPQLGATRVATGATAIAMTYGARCITGNGGTSCISKIPKHIEASTWTPTEAAQLSLHAGGGYAVRADGTVVSFGSNVAGERGMPSATTAPAAIPGLTGVKKTIATSALPKDYATRGGCALKLDGTVWCWGSGEDGRNGDGTTSDRNEPVQVMRDETTPLTGVTDLAGTNAFRCAITAEDVYCWGEHLMNEGFSSWAAPMTSEPITDGVSITTGWEGACVLRSSGRITCVGETPFSDEGLVDYDGFLAPTP